MPGYTKIELERIASGLCHQCGRRKVREYLKCEDCRSMTRDEWRSKRRRQQIDAAPVLPSHKDRIKRMLKYLGDDADLCYVIELANLQRDDKIRFNFFKAIFEERKWIVGEFPDYLSARRELNELLADCIHYAKEIPNPQSELEELTAARQIETHDRSITALAMEQLDGMTSDDFAAVNHLY